MSMVVNSSFTCPGRGNSQRLARSWKTAFIKSLKPTFVFVSHLTCILSSAGPNPFLRGGDHKCHWLPPPQRNHLQRSEGLYFNSNLVFVFVFLGFTSYIIVITFIIILHSWRTCCWTRTATSRSPTLASARKTSNGARPPRYRNMFCLFLGKTTTKT